RHDVEHGGLARAVGPDEPHDFARLDGKGDVGQHRAAHELLLDRVKTQQAHVRTLPLTGAALAAAASRDRRMTWSTKPHRPEGKNRTVKMTRSENTNMCCMPMARS